MQAETKPLTRSIQPCERASYRTAPLYFPRFLVLNSATGVVIGALFIAAVLMSDAGGIATLIDASTTSLLSATLFVAKGIVLCASIVVLLAILAATTRSRGNRFHFKDSA